MFASTNFLSIKPQASSSSSRPSPILSTLYRCFNPTCPVLNLYWSHQGVICRNNVRCIKHLFLRLTSCNERWIVHIFLHLTSDALILQYNSQSQLNNNGHNISWDHTITFYSPLAFSHLAFLLPSSCHNYMLLEPSPSFHNNVLPMMPMRPFLSNGIYWSM